MTERRYLSTGITVLDRILATDAPQKQGGIVVPSVSTATATDSPQAPVVLVNGETGTGKTTLMLQMAFNIARASYEEAKPEDGATPEDGEKPEDGARPEDGAKPDNPIEEPRWVPFFCPLEQTVRSLGDMAASFGSFNEDGVADVRLVDLAGDRDEPGLVVADVPCVYMVHLAPRPISEAGGAGLVQTRLEQLDHILSHVLDRSKKAGIRPVLFVDSMDAFSSDMLKRNEIYRLFSLFRNRGVPAFLTMERHLNYQQGIESDSVQNAKFLADVVISLRKDRSSGYLLYYLEVEKSRVSRQALGRHVYKIRTQAVAGNVGYDRRTGIVPYPSTHFVLSKPVDPTAGVDPKDADSATSEDHGAPTAGVDTKSADGMAPKVQRDPVYVLWDQQKTGDALEQIVRTPDVAAGACFSIIGPPGTHKLALGMNLAMGNHMGSAARVLIVNFGGSGNLNLGGVAWTNSHQDCRDLERLTKAQSEFKFWKADYCDTSDPDRKPRVTTITFRIGELTPEECFYVVDKVLDEGSEGEPVEPGEPVRPVKPFTSVLLSDTAELCNGFPLLASDPLFLPALIELFAARKMVTVCIGVDEGASAKNTDINYSLASRADYRIVLSHYPTIPELSQEIVKAGLGHTEVGLKEQLVSLVVDNVTGKHYERELRWLWVETDEPPKLPQQPEQPRPEQPKTLHCGTAEEALKALGASAGARDSEVATPK